MALSLGPGITLGPGVSITPTQGVITAGLILALDAGNTASYPGTGATWYDISGADNNTGLVGTTPWTYSGAQSYFTFSPSQGYAQGGYILPNTAYTKISVFRYFSSLNNIISGSGTAQHAFWGAFGTYLQSGHNGNWSTIISAVPVPTSRWAFGAVSFNNITGWRLYLNNESVVTNSNTEQFTANPAMIEIGAFDGNANNLNGDMAVSLIYNRALSDAEVASIYTYYNPRFGF